MKEDTSRDMWVYEHNKDFKIEKPCKLTIVDEIGVFPIKKEVYVYREDGDTFATLSKKLDVAAKEVGIFSLSSKKRRMLLSELSKKSSVVVCGVEPKTYKKDTTTNIEVSDSTLLRLVAKKIGKGFSSYDKAIVDCLDKLDAIENMMNDTDGSEFDCTMVCASIYDLFNGGRNGK